MNQIIREIKGNKITKLNLREKLNNLSDLEKICNALKTNTSINEIDLSYNQIDDTGS